MEGSEPVFSSSRKINAPSNVSEMVSDLIHGCQMIKEENSRILLMESDERFEDVSAEIYSLVSNAVDFFSSVPFDNPQLVSVFAAFLSFHSKLLQKFNPLVKCNEFEFRDTFALFWDLFMAYSSALYPCNFDPLADKVREVIHHVQPIVPLNSHEYIDSFVPHLIDSLYALKSNTTVSGDVENVEKEFRTLKNEIIKLHEDADVPPQLLNIFKTLQSTISIWKMMLIVREKLVSLQHVCKRTRLVISLPEDANLFVEKSAELLLVHLRVLSVWTVTSWCVSLVEIVHRIITIAKVHWHPSIIDLWGQFYREAEEKMNLELLSRPAELCPDLVTMWENSDKSCSVATKMLMTVCHRKMNAEHTSSADFQSMIVYFSKEVLVKKIVDDMSSVKVMLEKVNKQKPVSPVTIVYNFMKKQKVVSPVFDDYLRFLELIECYDGDCEFANLHPSDEQMVEMFKLSKEDTALAVSEAYAQLSGTIILKGDIDGNLGRIVPFGNDSFYASCEYVEKLREYSVLMQCLSIIPSEFKQCKLEFRQEPLPGIVHLRTIVEHGMKYVRLFKTKDSCDAMLSLVLSILYDGFQSDRNIDRILEKLLDVIVISPKPEIVGEGLIAIHNLDYLRARQGIITDAEFRGIKNFFDMKTTESELDRVILPIKERSKTAIASMIKPLREYRQQYVDIQKIVDLLTSCLPLPSVPVMKESVCCGFIAFIQKLVCTQREIMWYVLGEELFNTVESTRAEVTLAELMSQEEQSNRIALINRIFAALDYMNTELIYARFQAVVQAADMASHALSGETNHRYAVEYVKDYIDDFVSIGDPFILKDLFDRTMKSRKNSTYEEEYLAQELDSFMDSLKCIWQLYLLALYFERSDSLKVLEDLIDSLSAKLAVAAPAEVETIVGNSSTRFGVSDFARNIQRDIEESKYKFSSHISTMRELIALRRMKTSDLRPYLTTVPRNSCPFVCDVEECDVEAARKRRDDMFVAGNGGRQCSPPLISAISQLLAESVEEGVSEHPVNPEMSFARQQLCDAMKARSRIKRGLMTLKFTSRLEDASVPEQIRALCSRKCAKRWTGPEDPASVKSHRKLKELQSERDTLYCCLVKESHESTRSAVRNSDQIAELMEKLRELDEDFEKSSSTKYNVGDIHTKYLAVTNDLYQYIIEDSASLEASIEKLQKQLDEMDPGDETNLQKLLKLGKRIGIDNC